MREDMRPFTRKPAKRSQRGTTLTESTYTTLIPELHGWSARLLLLVQPIFDVWDDASLLHNPEYLVVLPSD